MGHHKGLYGSGTTTNAFRQGSSDNDPWYIGSEDALTATNSAGTGTGLSTTAAEYYDPIATAGYTLPAAFPKGYLRRTRLLYRGTARPLGRSTGSSP